MLSSAVKSNGKAGRSSGLLFHGVRLSHRNAIASWRCASGCWEESRGAGTSNAGKARELSYNTKNFSLGRRARNFIVPGLVAFAGATAASLTIVPSSHAHNLSLSSFGASNSHNSRNLSSTGADEFGGGVGNVIKLYSPVKLFQYASCPFCNKTQAFMEYHGIAHEKVEVNPLSKEQIKFSSYKMVPLALVNGEQVNGSCAIIDALLGGEEAAAARRTEDERKWINWVDDHLVHLLPPNIYRSPLEALQAFDYITNNSGDFTFAQRVAIRYAGAAIMFLVAKRSKKKYNLSDDPRRDLREACEYWATEGLASGERQFHGGDTINDADLVVFGVLRSIDGNYQTWEDLKASDFANKEHFWRWFDQVKDQVAKNKER